MIPCTVAVLLCLVAYGGRVHGFVPLSRTYHSVGAMSQPHSTGSCSRPVVSKLATLNMEPDQAQSDVSVPVDSAARLAYDEWRTQFNKGAFDEQRFVHFKQNYETITVANIMAKKKARDEGTVSQSVFVLALNEYGDYSADEYAVQRDFPPTNDVAPTEARRSNAKVATPVSTQDILNQAVEAAVMTTEASSALEEAADALAEEEQKLMEMLGYDTVEELELALDSLEGIAPDGGDLDDDLDVSLESSTLDNLAREARVRAAYFQWCNDFDKVPDESVFPTFSNNFLLMEQYAKESSKEMTLNQYADFTKDEYEAFLKSGASTAPATPAAPTPAAVVESKPAAVVESKPAAVVESKPAPPAAPRVEPSSDAKSGLGKFLELAAQTIESSLQEIDEKTERAADRDARLKEIAEEQVQAEQEAAAARSKRAAEVAARAQEEVARRQTIEEQRVARERALAAEAAKVQKQAEATAIADAKAQAEREATRAAQRAYFDAQAAKEARDKARAWEEQQAKLRASKVKVAPKKPAQRSFFAALNTAPAKVTPVPKVVVQKPPAVVKKPVVAVKPAAPKPAPAAPATPAFSFFNRPAPAVKKVVVAPKPAPAPPVVAAKPAATPSSPFSFFGGAQTPKAKVAPAPTPVVAAPKKVAEKPAFSFFSGAKPAPAAKSPAPAPVPAAAKPATGLSFFGKPAAVTPAKKIELSVPKKAGTISIFTGKEAAAKKDVKVPSRSGTINIVKATGTKPNEVKPSPSFSLFSPLTKPAATAAPKKAEPVARSPTLSLFSSPLPKKPEPKKVDVKVPNRGGTIGIVPKAESKPAFSFFGGSSTPKAATPAAKSAAPADTPVLSQWKQNADGSLSGKVSNSKNYRSGTVITTSPVRKGAKAGSVVKTGSGSQYYLS